MFGSGGADIQGCWLGQRCVSGVFVTDRGRVTLSSCVVSLCSGAGLHCSGSSSVVADATCVIMTRKAGLFCEKNACVRLSDCTLMRNAYGAAHAVDNAHVTMTDCRQNPQPFNRTSATLQSHTHSHTHTVTHTQSHTHSHTHNHTHNHSCLSLCHHHTPRLQACPFTARRRLVQRQRRKLRPPALSLGFQQDGLCGRVQRRRCACRAMQFSAWA